MPRKRAGPSMLSGSVDADVGTRARS